MTKFLRIIVCAIVCAVSLGGCTSGGMREAMYGEKDVTLKERAQSIINEASALQAAIAKTGASHVRDGLLTKTEGARLAAELDSYTSRIVAAQTAVDAAQDEVAMNEATIARELLRQTERRLAKAAAERRAIRKE